MSVCLARIIISGKCSMGKFGFEDCYTFCTSLQRPKWPKYVCALINRRYIERGGNEEGRLKQLDLESVTALYLIERCTYTHREDDGELLSQSPYFSIFLMITRMKIDCWTSFAHKFPHVDVHLVAIQKKKKKFVPPAIRNDNRCFLPRYRFIASRDSIYSLACHSY